VCDIEFCESKGVVKKLIVPGQAKAFGLFGREEELCISWDCIKKIGSDIILVEIDGKKAGKAEVEE
jgi:YlmC/YmxH family sporulation protein